MQPIKELSAAGRCAGRGCALIRQLANNSVYCICDVQAFQLPLHSSAAVRRAVAVYKNWFQVRLYFTCQTSLYSCDAAELSHVVKLWPVTASGISISL